MARRSALHFAVSSCLLLVSSKTNMGNICSALMAGGSHLAGGRCSFIRARGRVQQAAELIDEFQPAR